MYSPGGLNVIIKAVAYHSWSSAFFNLCTSKQTITVWCSNSNRGKCFEAIFPRENGDLENVSFWWPWVMMILIFNHSIKLMRARVRLDTERVTQLNGYTNLPENAENIQICPVSRFLWLFYQYVYYRSTPFFRILAHQTDVLSICSLSMKSRNGTLCDVNMAAATHQPRWQPDV